MRASNCSSSGLSIETPKRTRLCSSLAGFFFIATSHVQGTDLNIMLTPDGEGGKEENEALLELGCMGGGGIVGLCVREAISGGFG